MSRLPLAELLACDRHEVRSLCVTARKRLAACPRTAADVQAMLASDPVAAVRAAYARSRHASPAALEQLAHDGDLDVADALTRRRHLSRSMLVALSRHAEPYIRRVVGARPDLPPELVERLLGDRDREVRLTTARSHYVSAEFLARCARSADPDWRQVAAFAKGLDPDLQRLLARDPCWQVRRYLPLAERIDQPLEVAVDLALASEIATDEGPAQFLVTRIKAYAARRPATDIPRPALVAFMRSPHPDIRALGRQLALAAHRTRADVAAAATDDVAA